MLIGIDGNEANVKNQVGVSVYTFKLLEYFQKQSNPDCRFVVYLRTPPLSHMPAQSEYYAYRVVGPKPLWSQIALPLALFKESKHDVFFSPAHYAPRISPVPTVVTIHDLSYFYFPQEFLRKDLYQLTNWTKYSVKRAKKVICVSKHTKKDLVKFYNISENKISVIHNGYDRLPPAASKTPLKDPYILFVGTLQPRKNITILIQAFSQFNKKNPEYKLVIVGKKGWLYEDIFKLVQNLELTNRVIFNGYTPDNELATLYKHAKCFVFPSLYDGFGIPLLEAMSFGCPVIASSTAALPEIGGDACLYFDPTNDEELVSKLVEITENKKVRSSLIKKGKDQIKKYSWEKCAQETLALLKNV